MSIASLLDQTLALQRATVSRDSSGATSRTFATLLANVPASITPAHASVVTDYARRDMIVDHRIYTTADLDTQIAGGVRLGDRFASGSTYYLVKAVKRTANAQVSAEVLYEIDCERKS